MKRYFKFFLILIFPFCVSGQIKTFQSSMLQSSFNSDTTKHISISPRLFGISSVSSSGSANTYIAGTTLLANISNKTTFISHFDYLGGNHNTLINEYHDSLGVFPGFGKEMNILQYNLKYSFNKFFIVDAGKGKHFIGNGYRSFLLSTEHSPYKYLKLTTEFGRVRYYNLYTVFLDIQNLYKERKKYSSIHFLDFRLTDKINIGFFEAVLWQAKNEVYNRGYDVEYLNPIIFYRPVEFSKHSPDNVLLGTNFNATFKSIKLYGQVLLDDLNVSRQKDRDEEYSGGFFQNKFAYQLGVQSSFKGVNTLLEYNQSQPYTYAHKEPIQSYTHMNQALSHPLGANFKEVVILANYSKEKWQYSIKLTLAKVGLDSVGTHYGQNIFASDFDAQGDGEEYSYGNFNGQGISTQINTFYAEVAYSLKWVDIFGSLYYKYKKSDLLDQTFLYSSVGIRTFPFSIFQDY